MDDFAPVPVSHHQLVIWTEGPSGDHLPLFTAGDSLLQIGGAADMTVLTGPHTGSVLVAVAAADGPPPADGWEAAAEATVWCPEGRLGVAGLMGGGAREIAVPAGLLRIRVSARERVFDDGVRDSAERIRIVAWPVDGAEGFRTLASDGMGIGTAGPDPGRAAGWAMTRLVDRANPDPARENLRRAGGWTPPPAGERRVSVRRSGTWPGPHDLTLPVGDLEVRIRDGIWRWVTRGPTRVPDETPSTVTVGPDGLVHDGVRAADAVLLGLVWDHLLTRDPAAPWPWTAVLADRAARAAADHRRVAAARPAREARRWGDRPPSDRQWGDRPPSDRQWGGRPPSDR